MIALSRRVALWLPVVAYMGLIYWLSSLSDPMPSVTSAVWDKALHFIEYAGLAVLLARAFSGEGVMSWRAFALAALAASLYAMSDELHQAGVAARMSDVGDWIADTWGGATGAAVYCLLTRPRNAFARSEG